MHNSKWLDTPERYGLISRCLHWAMAYLLVWQFVTLVGWRVLGDGTVMRTVSQLGPAHGTVGVLVLALLMPRIAWTVASWRRRQPPDQSFRRRVASLVHGIFYVLMFAVPSLALMRAYGSGKGYEFWGVRLVPQTGQKIAWLIGPADWLHGPLAWTLAVLVAGHIVMALLHQRSEPAAIKRMFGKRGS